MLLQEVIRRKRDGIALDSDEINYLIKGISDWSISSGQIAAFAMAVHIRGMAKNEIIAMTQAMAHTGKIINWSDAIADVPLIDVHSAGGVGDKTPILLAVMIAACGGYVPMIAGRTKHHTGGTLDKLDSITGYDTSAGISRFKRTVLNVGCGIIGQTNELIPAVQRFSSILDVTATGESIPIITASQLAKSLASGIDTMVANIPVGNGSFMKNIDEARSLGSSLVATAEGIGLTSSAVITDMNQVLGKTAGNALEILEIIDFLKGNYRDERLLEVTMAVGSSMLLNAGLAETREGACEQLQKTLDTGTAAETFENMVASLGGTGNILKNSEAHLPKAKVKIDVYPIREGIISSMRTRWIGLALLSLGGGRSKSRQRLDHSVGFSNICSLGDVADKSKPLATIHAADETAAYYAAEHLLGAIEISDVAPELPPVVYEII